MAQKTFYTNLRNHNIPETKGISAKFYGKGLIRKVKKNSISLIDNNSTISHVYVKKQNSTRGNSIQLLLTKLQHKRNKVYTGNFLLASSKIKVDSPAINFLKKLEGLTLNAKTSPIFKKINLTKLKERILTTLKSFKTNNQTDIFEERSRSLKYIKAKLVEKLINSSFEKKEKFFFLEKTKNSLKKIMKEEIVSLRKTTIMKQRSFKKFPLIIVKRSGKAGFTGYGSGMTKFLPRSNFSLVKNSIFLKLQKKIQLKAKNWEIIKSLKSLIPFRTMPAVLGKEIKIIPNNYKKNYSQSSMKKNKKNRADKKPRVSIKGIFLHTHKKIAYKRRKKSFQKKSTKISPQDENKTKQNQKRGEQLPRTSNFKKTKKLPNRD